MAAERGVGQLAQDGVDLRAIAALGDNPQLQRGLAQQAMQVYLLAVEVRRHQRLAVLAQHQATTEHAQGGHGKPHIFGALRRPQQGRVAGEAIQVLQHLDAAGAVDPHDAVVVLGHLPDQQGQQLVDHPLAFFRPFQNGERRQVAHQPEDALLGTGRLQQQCGQQPAQQDQVA
ncbi:hypothetical protein D3C76_1337800 [compost metagenome]